MDRVPEEEIMDDPTEVAMYEAMDNLTPIRAFIERGMSLGLHGKVLDIGCGPGDFAIEICQRHRDVTVLSIDASINMLDVAKQKATKVLHAHRMDFRFADARDLPFMDAYFNSVVSNTVLHHLDDPREVLQEAWRVLKPGGLFLIRDLVRPENENQVRYLVNMHAANAGRTQQELFAESLRAAFTMQEMGTILEELGLDDLKIVRDADRYITIQGHKS